MGFLIRMVQTLVEFLKRSYLYKEISNTNLIFSSHQSSGTLGELIVCEKEINICTEVMSYNAVNVNNHDYLFNTIGVNNHCFARNTYSVAEMLS